jgi:hypothetical protein
LAVLATSGPAGVQTSEVRCEAIELNLYLLLPKTSDHLFNLEHEATMSMLTSGWELKGEARIVPSIPADLDLGLVREPGMEWCVLVHVIPRQVQIRRGKGWGNIETIDLPSYSK